MPFLCKEIKTYFCYLVKHQATAGSLRKVPAPWRESLTLRVASDVPVCPLWVWFVSLVCGADSAVATGLESVSHTWNSRARLVGIVAVWLVGLLLSPSWFESAASNESWVRPLSPVWLQLWPSDLFLHLPQSAKLDLSEHCLFQINKVYCMLKIHSEGYIHLLNLRKVIHF